MTTTVWDWACALYGIRPTGELFLPNYWWIPSKLGMSIGWVPEPALIAFLLILGSLLAVVMFFWRRQRGWMYVAFGIWGLLAADTPFVVAFPALLELIRILGLRLVRDVDEGKIPWLEFFRLPWLSIMALQLMVVFALAFLVVGIGNFFRVGPSYISGYVRNAHTCWNTWRHPKDSRRMDEMLNEYVDEIVREAGDRKWIFTDGLTDAGIEWKTRGELQAIPLIEVGHNLSHWWTKGLKKSEDLVAVKDGPGALLRAWVEDRPENITNAVYQCGFQYLEKVAADRTVPQGLVLRAGGCSEEELRRANEAVVALGNEIADFCKHGGDSMHGGRVRSARFLNMQWRVARAIRRYATWLDRRQMLDEALANTALSEELDRLNPLARRQLCLTDVADFRTFGSFSPREGLQFALKRANFILARNYAWPILKDDPGNAEANFGMAMSHIVFKEYSQAKHYLEIALKSRPNDPTLLNNLAVTMMELGDFDGAEKQVQAALKVAPASESVRDTQHQLDTRRRLAEKYARERAEAQAAEEARKRQAEQERAAKEAKKRSSTVHW